MAMDAKKTRNAYELDDSALDEVSGGMDMVSNFDRMGGEVAPECTQQKTLFTKRDKKSKPASLFRQSND